MSSNKLKIQKPESQKNRLKVAKPTVSSGSKKDISKEQVEILDTVLNSLTHPFLIIDANDFTIKKCNNVASPDKLPPGTTCYQLTHGSDKPCGGKDHVCPIRHIKKTKKPAVVEHKHIDEDGNQKVFEVHGFPIFDDLGEVVEITEYLFDITERKQNEEKILQSHNELKAAQRIAHMGSWEIDLKTDVITASDEFYRIHDYEPQQIQITRKMLLDNVHPDDQAHLNKIIKSLFNAIPIESEFRIYTGSGKLKHVLIRGKTKTDSSGNHICFSGTIIDITKRKQSENLLKENEKLLHKIAENYPNSFISIIEKDYTVGFTSGQEFIKQQLDPNQFIGMTLDQVFGKDSEFIKTQYDKAFNGDECHFEFELNGMIQLYKVVPLFSEEGSVSRILVVVENITERKLAEKTLQESDNRFKDVLNHSRDIVYRFNLQTGTYDYVSPSIEKACGITSEEYIKGGLELALTLIHPEDKERLQEHIDNLPNKQLKSKIDPIVEYRFKHPDKGWQWFSDSRAVIYDDLGEAIGVVGCSRNIDKKRMDEEKIKNQQYYLSKAQEIGNMGTWELDLIKNILVWTEENYRIFGVPGGTELNYEIFLERIHPDDREYVNREWMAAIDGKPYDIDHRLIVDGKVEWVREKADLIYDDNGKPIKAIGFTQNISTQKQAEEVLKTEHNILQEVMNGAKNIHLVYLDRDFNFVRVNKTYADTCGYKSNEMVGKNHFDLYPHAENEAIFKKVRETGDAYFVKDKPFSFPDKPELGVTYWDWSLCPVIGKQGDVDGLIFSLVETTERKQAEIELSNVFNLCPDMICVASPDGKFVKINPSWEKTLGYTTKEIMDFGWKNLIHPDDIVQTKKEVQGQLDGKNTINFVNRYRCNNGTYKVFEWQSIALKDGLLYATAHDITEGKRAEEGLRIAHEKLVTEQVALRTKNIAMKEIMGQIESEKKQLQIQIRNKVERIIKPIIRNLEPKISLLDKQYIELLENSLDEVTMPFTNHLEIGHSKLSSRELEVCNMIKNGMSSKDIASALSISVYTVHNQRRSIRKKLKINDNKTNLITFLQSD
ncbi:MAG: PAS domain S-box protein [candidate division Zixibacteria bacterium]|nr:PAS domain S-box protein [candidate division Zixibacteria bacterium]